MRVPEKIGGVISGLVLAMFLYGPAWAQNPNTDQSPNQQQNPQAEQRPITSTDQIPSPEQNPNQGQNPNDQQAPNQNQQKQSPYGNPGQYPNQNPNAAERQNSHPGRPGSINYVEGKAMLDGQPLTPESVGNAVMDRGQVLTTQAGKVEVLLNPGIFLRIADNSAVKMISPDLANIEVEVDRGRAMVEAADFTKNNSIRIDLAGSNTQLLKNGLYDFDASQGQVRVFSGKANVSVNNQKVGVGEHHEVSISAGGKLKTRDFDSKQYSDDFYRWAGLRSGYLAEADADIARLYVNGGAGWVGAGWYWSPWFSTYTFIPGDGIFYSPFGWGFYSPFAVYGSPFFYGGYYGGYYGHPHHFGEFHGPYGHGFEPHGGFHAGGVSGGGFHGGGGGFHGGGGGGGRH